MRLFVFGQFPNKMPYQLLRYLLVGGLIFFGWHANLAAQPAAKNAFKQMDQFFRSTYSLAREQTLKNAGPIIHVQSEDLTLLYKGEMVASATPTQGYRTLTTVSHITLSIFLLLEPYGEGAISEDRLNRLQQLRNLAETVQSKLTSRLSENLELAGAQHQVIGESLSLIKKIVAEKKWAERDLDAFLDTVKPQILQNVKLAAKFRIDHFHHQIEIWKQKISTEDWSRLHVVVSGAAMPRKNNIAVQYFSKLLGVRGEGAKIIYAESVFQQKRAMEILGTSLLDAQIGKGYFSDPWRMHRDLLGNAAAVYLDGLSLSLPE